MSSFMPVPPPQPNIGPSPNHTKRHSLARGCGQYEGPDRAIYCPHIPETAFNIEIDMGQQVRLGDDHDLGGSEHVRVFERLVVALGDREHHDLGALAEIE